jgi:hypothetical protein
MEHAVRGTRTRPSKRQQYRSSGRMGQVAGASRLINLEVREGLRFDAM